MNPSRIMHGASPTRVDADFLHGMTEGLGPYGPEFDSGWMRQQNILGLIDSTRGVITSKGMQDLLAQSVTKNECGME
jgi:hypothetical protein